MEIHNQHKAEVVALIIHIRSDGAPITGTFINCPAVLVQPTAPMAVVITVIAGRNEVHLDAAVKTPTVVANLGLRPETAAPHHLPWNHFTIPTGNGVRAICFRLMRPATLDEAKVGRKRQKHQKRKHLEKVNRLLWLFHDLFALTINEETLARPSSHRRLIRQEFPHPTVVPVKQLHVIWATPPNLQLSNQQKGFQPIGVCLANQDPSRFRLCL